MLTRHTPGPWVLDAPEPESGRAMVEGTLVIANEAEPGRHLVAEVLSHDEEEGEGRHDADAALIAAAPDLLEACRAALGHLTWADVDTPIAQQARAAIAKAEG